MSDSTIEGRVLTEIQRMLGLDKAPKLTATFVGDLGCDSFDSVELVMAFEDEFCIDVDDDEAEKVSTVADAIALVNKLNPS